MTADLTTPISPMIVVVGSHSYHSQLIDKLRGLGHRVCICDGTTTDTLSDPIRIEMREDFAIPDLKTLLAEPLTNRRDRRAAHRSSYGPQHHENLKMKLRHSKGLGKPNQIRGASRGR